MRSTLHIILAALLPGPAAFGGQVTADTHATGGYNLHFHVVTSDFLNDQPQERAVLRQHGLPLADGYGIANVVVFDQSEGEIPRPTVPADVRVRVRDITGRVSEVPMQRIAAQDRSSYVGAFAIDYGAPMHFDVSATPKGSAVTLELSAERRFLAPAGASAD